MGGQTPLPQYEAPNTPEKLEHVAQAEPAVPVEPAPTELKLDSKERVSFVPPQETAKVELPAAKTETPAVTAETYPVPTAPAPSRLPAFAMGIALGIAVGVGVGYYLFSMTGGGS